MNPKIFISLLLPFFLTSCLLAQTVIDSSSQSILRELVLNLPFIEKNSKVTVEIKDGMVLMEGDILIGKASELVIQKSIATNRSNARWRKGVIPFVIQNGHPRSSDIIRAIQHINQKTNIQLVQRTNELDYLLYVIGNGGCSSYVGKTGGFQHVNIGPNCGFGAIVHETCHAAGLWHEQSRCDRDNFVTIYWQNIRPNHRHNFEKHCRDGIDIGNYDYESIMHYEANAFSINGQPTILPKNTSIKIGNRKGLSQGDILALNKLYPTTTTTTIPVTPPITGNNNRKKHKLVAALQDFTIANGWDKDKHVRAIGDVNGDGRADIIAFGDDAVFISVGKSNGKFSKPKIGIRDFSYYNGNWEVDKHERRVGDVNGDGQADIIGFGQLGVLVALSNKKGGFEAPIVALADFAIGAGGWEKDKHERRIGDVNGDGRADIIGFGEGSVLIALGQKNGTFSTPYIGIQDFTYASGGWRTDKHERVIGDVNGDGQADIIGFGEYKVLVSLANKNGTFQQPIIAVNDYTYGTGGWRKNKHVRRVGDVNGDGRADIIGFGEQAVFVSYGNKNGTFSTPKALIKDFTYGAGGWRTEKHERLIGDVNGDKRADIIGFGGQMTFTYSFK